MRVVALVSGGKDSCYSMQLCKQHGHEIVALANLLPEESAPDELDSFCFQTVGHQLIEAYAACMGIPLFRKRISGTSSVQDLGYSPTEGDEVEDLYQLLAYVKENVPGIQAVASGAIASDYQRLRVENVCSRLNLVSLAYLWHQPQRMLLRGMVDSGVEAIVVKVACLGLHPRKHLGRTIAAMEPVLLSLADAYGCNVCGEGGEYETLTLDCPVFTRGCIQLNESEIVLGTSDVGHLVPKSYRVLPKAGWEGSELPSDVRLVPGDYVAAHRVGFGRCNAPSPPLPLCALATVNAALPPPVNAIAVAAGFPAAVAASAAAANGSSAASMDALLQPVAPSSFHVQVSMCSGPDYVQLVCRAVRPRSALPSDLTECDTTAALHALLATAEQELAAQHMDLHHCLFVHLFLANMGHFQAANGVYCKHFPSRDPPSRACVQVCLPHDCPVMCEFLLARGAAPPAVAATGAARLPLPPGPSPPLPSPPPPLSPVSRHTRKVLHVQSISSWAPSCIGPYSQATSYRGLVFMAGVIPLDPPVMTLVPGDITAQVLRAMMSCEAVAVAQRTTVVGAALGLTVYLAAAVGGGAGLSVGSGSGAVGGGGSVAPAERNGASYNSSGGGAELRALTRSAVEAILEHGLPGHPGYSQHRYGGPPGGCSASGGPSSGPGGFRYHRSSTCDSVTSGTATPRSSHSTWPGVAAAAAGAGVGHGRVSAPPSRRAVLLGADGLDEEEEEAERDGAGRGRITGSGQLSAMSAVLDPYLQPPEVRVSVRPSVLYVTVPSLPRGSLVEIQPVCLDVEALAVIRKLTGHESFIKRRTNSHHDAASLHQSSAIQNNSHSHHGGMPAAQPPGLPADGQSLPPISSSAMFCSSTCGGGAAAAVGFTTSWSELPPTPRASFDSLASRDGGGSHSYGGFHNHHHHHGSSPVQWQASADLLAMGALASPLPNHMLSAAGFMSPDAGGSLAGTPSAGPSMLSRQRSSGLGLLAANGAMSSLSLGGGGGSGGGSFQRCLSPQPQLLGALPPLHQQTSGSGPWPHPVASVGGQPQLPGLHTPPHPPLSAHNSGHHLLSPTLQHLLQMQTSPQMLLQPAQPATADASSLQQQEQQTQQAQPAQQHVIRAVPGGVANGGHRLSSSNGGATASKDASMVGRTSYSGSSGSGSQSGALAQRSSLDGNILSFEICTGRGGTPVLLSPQPLGVTQSVNAAVASEGDAAVVMVSNGGCASAARARPSAIVVPQAAASGLSIHKSPFEGAAGAAAGAIAAELSAAAEHTPATALELLATGGASPLLYAAATSAIATLPPLPIPAHVPPALAIPAQSSGSGSDSTFTPGHAPGAAVAKMPSEGPILPAGATAARANALAVAGSSSSSDVMVTTVCCYGQVLRSLFHLPPAVFAPGVTTAQLTRRFRRAAASVLAAHGMDMSCLIWVRVWYERTSVEFTDDEYGTGASAAPPAAAAGGASAAGSHATAVGAFAGPAGHSGGVGPRVLHALEEDEGEDRSKGPRHKGFRGGSGSDDSGSSGGGVPATAVALALAAGGSTGGCSSPRPSAASRLISVTEVGQGGPGASAGGSTHCCPGSPAAAAGASPSTTHRRLSGLQPESSASDDLQGQSGQTHHHHHNRHNHHNHSHSHHHGAKDVLTTNGTQSHQPAYSQQQQHFHVAWVPVQRVATNASPQPTQCVAVLELLAALPSP